MKKYLLKVKDSEHKMIKQAAADYKTTMKNFIMAAIRFYLDRLKEEK